MEQRYVQTTLKFLLIFGMLMFLLLTINWLIPKARFITLLYKSLVHGPGFPRRSPEISFQLIDDNGALTFSGISMRQNRYLTRILTARRLCKMFLGPRIHGALIGLFEGGQGRVLVTLLPSYCSILKTRNGAVVETRDSVEKIPHPSA